MKSFTRMSAIMVKEIRQLSRDRITFGMVIMIPLIQLILFGFAMNTDVRNIPVAIVDKSESAPGRVIVEAVKVTQVVNVKAQYATVKEAEMAIREGVVRAALILPTNLTQRITHQETLGSGL